MAKVKNVRKEVQNKESCNIQRGVPAVDVELVVNVMQLFEVHE